MDGSEDSDIGIKPPSAHVQAIFLKVCTIMLRGHFQVEADRLQRQADFMDIPNMVTICSHHMRAGVGGGWRVRPQSVYGSFLTACVRL